MLLVVYKAYIYSIAKGKDPRKEQDAVSMICIFPATSS